MNDKLREALAIVEKYGMKGDVIYKEIEALAASKQEQQAQAGPEQCQLRACDQSTGREYFIKSGTREELQAEADRMNEKGRDCFVWPPINAAGKPEPQAQAEPEVVATLDCRTCVGYSDCNLLSACFPERMVCTNQSRYNPTPRVDFSKKDTP